MPPSRARWHLRWYPRGKLRWRTLLSSPNWNPPRIYRFISRHQESHSYRGLTRVTGSINNPLAYACVSNIVTEAEIGNTAQIPNKIEISLEEITRNMQNSLRSLDSADYRSLLNQLSNDSMTRICVALMKLVGLAMFNEPNVGQLKKSIYAIISNENVLYIDFRLSNHFTNVARMFKSSGSRIGSERVPAEHHISLILNDVEYREQMNYDPSRPGSHFDSTPVINRVEIVLDLNAFRNSPKNAKLLLQALYRVVSRNHLHDEDIKDIFERRLNANAEGTVVPSIIHVVKKEYHPNRTDFANVPIEKPLQSTNQQPDI